MQPRAVILAAGTSSRMGRQKLLEPFRGRPMIEYAIEAARLWDPLVVAGAAVADALRDRESVSVIVNDAPERGMAHSLALADVALPPQVPLIVLLADKPLITSEFIAELCEFGKDVDVAYPVSERGEPGHPVLFSARARAKMCEVPDGDTIRSLRDDPSLARRLLRTGERGAFFDVDTARQLTE